MRFLPVYLLMGLLVWAGCGQAPQGRIVNDFDDGWYFRTDTGTAAEAPLYPSSAWQAVTLPHDWSIAGPFDSTYPTHVQEAALPAGIGWYRKTFRLPEVWKDKRLYLAFDGVYRDSKVWINGQLVGGRPNGFIAFGYNITRYVRFGGDSNVVIVRVANDLQPNARWYTGSGIYRPVKLIVTGSPAIAPYGVFLSTRPRTGGGATVRLETSLVSDSASPGAVTLESAIYDSAGRRVGRVVTEDIPLGDSSGRVVQTLTIDHPQRWSPARPYLYRVESRVTQGGSLTDQVETSLGVRYFRFSRDSGFFFNGRHLAVRGVCLHDDLGGLGAAVSKAAILRRLKLLKQMGCNAIRTAHNAPSSAFLEAADETGFLVMEDAFDVWKRKKVKYDYHLYWDRWHREDLRDQVLRDRSHPSIFIWNIGNEIPEQFDSSGITKTRELVTLVHGLDSTRPVTSALTEIDSGKNFIYQSGALDVTGINYNHRLYPQLKTLMRGPFIATETMSALETRGYYRMPSDSIERWPTAYRAPFKGNADYAVSAYDNRSAYWGSTHEETLKALRQCPYIAGLFVWSGFDYLGEQTPYGWPARSSYFGILDLAGFPKDAYYLYQSLWTDTPVLHVFPHWNWKAGDTVDVWAYYNDADRVALFLNGRPLGVKSKQNGQLHVMWRVAYEAGTLKAVSFRGDSMVLVRYIHTAGQPHKLVATADRTELAAGGHDLAFVSVSVVDSAGNPVPDADNPVHFSVSGPGSLVATNNGYEADLSSFHANPHSAFHGLLLGVVRTGAEAGRITVKVSAPGLEPAELTLKSAH